MNEAQGRVYLLQFDTGRKMFFWMQEPSAEKDTELIDQLNKILREGPPAEEQPNAKGTQPSLSSPLILFRHERPPTAHTARR